MEDSSPDERDLSRADPDLDALAAEWAARAEQGMTLAELQEFNTLRRELSARGQFLGFDERAHRAEPYSATEIGAELALIFRDIERFIPDVPGADAAAAVAANAVASIRDLGRPIGPGGTLGGLAGLITLGWLLPMAGADVSDTDFVAGIARARIALDDSERQTVLGTQLHELIDELVSGEGGDEYLTRRMGEAREAANKR